MTRFLLVLPAVVLAALVCLWAVSLAGWHMAVTPVGQLRESAGLLTVAAIAGMATVGGLRLSVGRRPGSVWLLAGLAPVAIFVVSRFSDAF